MTQSKACHAGTGWSQKVKSTVMSVMPAVPAGCKMAPTGSNSDTWKQQMFPKQTRLSDWFPLFIRCVIVLLSITPRCAVCARVTALCIVMLAALQQGSSHIAAQVHCCSRTGKARRRLSLCTPIKRLIGTKLLCASTTVDVSPEKCTDDTLSGGQSHLTMSCCSDSYAWSDVGRVIADVLEKERKAFF